MTYIPATTVDEIAKANRVFNIKSEPFHKMQSTVADVTNGTDGTYNYYLDYDTFRRSVFQLILDGGSGTVTVTFEATAQDDGTAPASCTYEDVSSDVFGSATFTADAYLIDNVGKFAGAKYVKVKVVASTGDQDDADWTIYHKRLF